MGIFQKKDSSYMRCCIATFLILFLSSSFVVVFDILSSAATIALWLLTALIIMFDLKCVFTKNSDHNTHCGKHCCNREHFDAFEYSLLISVN